MIIIFLVLVSLGTAAFIFINNKKLLLLKQQLLLVNNQNNNLKNKLSKFTSSKNLKFKFFTPNNTGGILKENTSVYISPIESSVLIHKLNIKMEVYIIDMVENSKIVWYYVALPLDSNINSRGWVKKSDFTIFYNNSQSVSKKI